ncbi:MAG: CNNM domain-containing protein [candidate division WOR-3 bacterium]
MALFLGCLALLLGGFYAGSETSYTRANWIRLATWQKNKRFGAGLALKILSQKEKVLVSTLIGTNLATVLASMLIVHHFAINFGVGYATFATGLVIVLSLIFSEFLPKTVAQAFPDHWASVVAYPILWTMKIFAPVTNLLYLFAVKLTVPFHRQPKGHTGEVIPLNDLVFTLREYFRSRRFYDKSLLGNYLAGIAYRLFEFRRVKVAEIAIPLARVIAIPEDITFQDLCNVIKKYGYSRYPVYRGTVENITGVIHTKDLLDLSRKRIRQVYTVSAQKSAMAVLTEMQKKGEHLAIVQEEKNRVIGIVTLEDLIEELVGEIRSED